MAKSKEDWLEEAAELGIKHLTEDDTVKTIKAEIEKVRSAGDTNVPSNDSKGGEASPTEPEPEKVQESQRRLEFARDRSKDYEQISDSILKFEGDLADSKIIDSIKVCTMKAKQAMHAEQIQLRTLANMEVELSMLLQRLAERIAMAGYNERAAEYNLKTVQERLKVILVDEGKAIGVADSTKVYETKDEYEVWSHSKYLLDNINLLRKSTDKTIDTIRSKLSYEKNIERP